MNIWLVGHCTGRAGVEQDHRSVRRRVTRPRDEHRLSTAAPSAGLYQAACTGARATEQTQHIASSARVSPMNIR